MELNDSPIVAMANEAQRPTRWWLAWILGVVFVVAGFTIGGAVGGVVLGDPQSGEPRAQYLEAFMFGTTAVLLILWVRIKERRGLSSLGFRGRNGLARFGLGLLLGAGLMTLGILIPTLTGDLATGRSQHALQGSAAALSLIPLLLLFITQSSIEEAVFRGYMLPMGMRQIPAVAAVIGTSIIFAAIHPGAGLVGSVNIFLYGAFACLVAIQQGSLWLICGFHAGWNYFQGNIYGVPVSGNPEPTSLLTFGPTEGSNALLSGGSFGIEASLVGTVLLVVGILITLVALRRKDAPRRAATRST